LFDSKWKEIKSRIRDILGDPEMGIDIIQGAEIISGSLPKPTELTMSTFTENVGISASPGSETGYGRLGGYMKLSRPGIPSR